MFFFFSFRLEGGAEDGIYVHDIKRNVSLSEGQTWSKKRKDGAKILFLAIVQGLSFSGVFGR